MTINNNYVIEVDHLTVSYHAKPALLDVSINIEKDQLVGVIGPNGAGKSTFIKAILGFIKPDVGTVKINGRSAQKVKGEVAYEGTQSLADGTSLKKQSVEAALDQLVSLLADKEGAARIGADAQSAGGSQLTTGSIASQLLELLGLIDGKAGVATANTWKKRQTLQAQPALACPDPGSGMHLLIHVPTNLAPIRVYVGDGALWITTNAEWKDAASQWHADVSHANSIHTGPAHLDRVRSHAPKWGLRARRLRRAGPRLDGVDPEVVLGPHRRRGAADGEWGGRRCGAGHLVLTSRSITAV